MNRLTRRGWIVLVWIPAITAALLLTYITRDVCYVGNMEGNFLGYGSCNEMLDIVIGDK